MAENYTQVNSYQDKLLEAMSIVSSQLISSIPYDKTITCTIVDDEHKAEGKYTVTNGDATFDAYSSDTKLKKEDVVYVTIPEGDYENQKIIQGKKTSGNEKPFVFTTPFDTILDLTDNLITNEATEGFVAEPKSSLIANNGYITKKEVVDQQEIETVNSWIERSKRICHLKNLNLTGYSRLGLKADFMSWIPTVSKGSYGLKITVMDNLNTTTTDDKQVTSVQQTKTLILDVADMYGSPYNFENYYQQEKVFPITELNTITDIIVDFYQIAGSFYDIDNNILTLQDATASTDADGLNIYTTEFGDNLFVNNVYIGLGYDVSEITDEYIVPVINDSITYSAYRENDLNKKRINLRWVHQFEDGPRVVKESDFTERLQGCEIAWYRYNLGAAASDAYCGVYWKRLSVDESGNLIDYDGKTKKVFEDVIQEDGSVVSVEKEYPDYGLGTQELLLTFSPDTTFQTEQIKCIIYLNDSVIRGPVITFTNEESVAGQQASNFINALEIECVDGTAGNYLLYLENGSILNISDSQEVRKLKCNFAETGTVAKSELLLDNEKGDYITWKIPVKNSMFSLSGYAMDKDTKTYKYTVNKKNSATGEAIESKSYDVSDNELDPVYIKNNYIIIQGEAAFDKNTNTILYPSYKISALYSMYNMNNTIACTVQKDRVIYTTELDFTFGVAGTMGTDKSLIIDFINGQTAIIAGDTFTAYQLEVKMYDEKNQLVDLNTVPITWSWYGGPELDDIDNTTRNLQFITTNTPIVALQNKGVNISNANDIYIAKVVVGEEGAELEAYFPIPIKSAEEYSHIEGATQVIYLSNGEPEFYKGEYKLYKTIDDTIGEAATEVVPSTTWSRISQENGKFVGDVVKQSSSSEKYILKPIGVYTSEVKNYAVLCKIDGNTVWQQPILVLQNKYPSRIVNKWDGKSIVMDEESGIILNTALASGRKESDNTFSGVMLGDWSGSGGINNASDKSLTDCTGIYGFNHGAMAYAFKDDGTAFIGKYGRGRIEFDGNSGTIGDATGNMTIDLDDGQIDAKCFKLQAGTGDEKLYLQTAKDGALTKSDNPLIIGKYFDVNWSGHISARSAKIGEWTVLATDDNSKLNADGSGISPGSMYSGYGSDWTSIILDPKKNLVTGGKFRASILEALNGTISLGGQIETYPFAKKANGEWDYTKIDYSSGSGKLGFVESNFGYVSGEGDIATGEEAPGIGITANGGGVVKATSKNVGMSISGSYLSITPNELVGKASSAQLRLDNNGIAITTGGNLGRLIADSSHSGIGYGSNYLTLGTPCQLNAASGLEIKINEDKKEIINTTSTNISNTTIDINATTLDLNSTYLNIWANDGTTKRATFDSEGNVSFEKFFTAKSGLSCNNKNISSVDTITAKVGSFTDTISGHTINATARLDANGTVDFSGAGTQVGIRAQFA